jgi:16S rRNA (guanine527-N7)-methyltransferase
VSANERNANASPSPEVSAGIGELADRFGLAELAAAQLAALTALVAEDPTAPTAVRDPGAILRDHIADSLVALELEQVREARTIADLGSGAGFPGLPLAAALPQANVILIESNGRKCEFLALAIDRMGLGNAVPAHSRVESLTPGDLTPDDVTPHDVTPRAATPRAATPRAALDVVTARAVAPLSVLAEYAAPLLRVGGHLVAWRGRRDPDAEAEAERAASELGLRVLQPIPVKPYPQAAHRHLHLMSKVRETPSRFPRRPGVAAKRPLGAV